MTDAANRSVPPSQGIDALIARLREQGVSAGREEGEKIVADARAVAKQIVDNAKEEAKNQLQAAQKQAEAFQSAGIAAIQMAMRDTILDLKSQLMQQFSSDVRRLVSRSLTDEALLRQMILEVAGRVRESVDAAGAQQIEVVLPAQVVGLDELRNNPDDLRRGKLTHFVLGLSDDILRRGVTFSVSDQHERGIRIQLVDRDISLELTDEAIAALLLDHLQPRFRAILEGIVK
jgi:V/A-type H+-transporting ATPase subunit E